MPVLPMIARTRRRCALLACLALAACADAPVPVSGGAPLFADAAFGPPTPTLTADEVFQVSPEMRAWLDTRVAAAATDHGSARGLVESLFVDRRVQVDYDAGYTRTAAQTFAAHAGNCLSLAIVTGALAKALGLEVRYQSVQAGEHWEREGDLLELVGHVNVTVGAPTSKLHLWGSVNERWTVDFMADRDLQGLATTPISEARIAAMFMNNRAAEALAGERVDEAYWWARRGIEADPGFPALYNTLGVTYWRKGLLHPAETAFGVALSKAPDATETWNNLTRVLRLDGQAALADRLEQQHPQSSGAARMADVNAGIEANAAGDYDRALALLRRALRTSADNHQLHYLLAVTYLNLGDRTHALQQLREARDDSTTAHQRAVYASKLQLLRSTSGGLRLDPDALRTE